MLFVNAIALVMHSAAQPAQPSRCVGSTDRVNIEVVKTAKAPNVSKRRRSQRFVIQKKYHIRWRCNDLLAKRGLVNIIVTHLSQVYLLKQPIHEAMLCGERAHRYNTLQ